MMTFHVQNNINQASTEPLLAILPGVALSELWQVMNVVENALLAIALCVFFSSVLGLSAMLMASLRERSHEVYLLRIMGASPLFLFALIEMEALIVTFLALILSGGLMFVLSYFLNDIVSLHFGIVLSINWLSLNILIYSLIIMISSLLIAAIPGFFLSRRA